MADIAAIEDWFVQRGVPHLIEDYAARTDIWTRALPLLVVAYVAGGLNALDVAGWSWQRNVLAAIVVIGILFAGWALTNVLLGRPFLSRPTQVGPPELVAFVLGPGVPSAVFAQWEDALTSVVVGLAVLAGIYLGTSYGVVPLTRWASGRAAAQVTVIGSLLVRALPLLLLFTTFLFINAEVWQVAGALDGVPYWATLGIFVALGGVFVLSRVPTTMRDLAAFSTWDEVADALRDTPAADIALPGAGAPPTVRFRARQKLNIALLMIFSPALQITAVALLLTAFFVLFGFLAIPLETTAGWTALDGVDVLATAHVSGRELVVTEPLLRVAAFLGAFTGMYFTVVLSTDATYRDEFAEDVRPHVHEVFAVRLAYLQARAGSSSTAGVEPGTAAEGLTSERATSPRGATGVRAVPRWPR